MGKVLTLMLALIKFVISFNNACLLSSSNFTEILSAPVAFQGLNLSIILEKVFSSVCRNSKESFLIFSYSIFL